MTTKTTKRYAADLYTTNCIACLEPATRWGGHVDMTILEDGLPSTQVTAGWCPDCKGVRPVKQVRIGNYGNWIPEYGLGVEATQIEGSAK